MVCEQSPPSQISDMSPSWPKQWGVKILVRWSARRRRGSSGSATSVMQNGVGSAVEAVDVEEAVDLETATLRRACPPRVGTPATVPPIVMVMITSKTGMVFGSVPVSSSSGVVAAPRSNGG